MVYCLRKYVIDVIKRTMRFGFARREFYSMRLFSFSLFSFDSFFFKFFCFVCNICVFSFYDFSLPQIILTGSNAVDFQHKRWTRIVLGTVTSTKQSLFDFLLLFFCCVCWETLCWLVVERAFISSAIMQLNCSDFIRW